MNEHSIKKLRRKFITLSFISLFSVMLIMGGTIFYVNYITTVRQMDNALNYLVEHGGEVDFDTPTRHWDGATYDSVSSSSENLTMSLLGINSRTLPLFSEKSSARLSIQKSTKAPSRFSECATSP